MASENCVSFFFLPMDYSLCEAKEGMSWTEPASSEVGYSKPAALLDFLSPFQVVSPGLLSRHTLDKILQVPPETQLLQRIVQPTWREKAQSKQTIGNRRTFSSNPQEKMKTDL